MRSYAAAATTKAERTNTMANLSASQGIGFILGPRKFYLFPKTDSNTNLREFSQISFSYSSYVCIYWLSGCRSQTMGKTSTLKLPIDESHDSFC